MVEHKVRVFFEPDTNAIGAEVKIYSEAGDEIDNILITTESKWKELDDKINNMDLNFIDRTELLTTIANIGEELVDINATSISGFTIDQLAKANHNELHTNYFAPINHAINTSRYGLAENDKYGHVKLIDNLNSNSFVNGEALSARQGKILQDNINVVNALLTPSFKCISYTQMVKESTGKYRFAEKSNIRLTKMGKLIICDIRIRANIDFGTANKEYQVVKLPSEYHPKNTVRQEWCHYQHNSHGFVVVYPDGNIQLTTNTANSKPVIYMNLAWVTQ